MGLNPPAAELSLDVKPTYIPKTISQFLGEVSRIGNVSERLMKLDDFVNRLEEEMKKIDAFKRELPLCMLLINDAIVALKEELMQLKKPNVEPVLEEFIPLKKSCDEDGNDEMNIRKEKDSGDKKNWLSSTQLWNTDENHPTTNSNHNHKHNSAVDIKKRAEEADRVMIDDRYQACRTSERAFLPFKGYCAFPMVSTTKEDKEELPVSGLSLITPGIKSPREEIRPSGLISKTSSSRAASCSSPNAQSNLRTGTLLQQHQQHQQSRKQRRCWSPELHKRFVNALQQLGGSQAATPKQIRELMQVDGLTNDEVKSHLQKYRLHTKRVPSCTSPPANQSVVVLGGGLWMPQDQYGESSKQSNSQSGSPQGPLQLTRTTGGTSTTGGDSMEEEEDAKSESYGWKSHLPTSGKDDV